MDINDTLDQRREKHGPWKKYSETSQRLKGICNAKVRPDYMNEGLDAICVKLARIITGDPMEPDHWHDIQGYARLVEKELLINDELATKLASPEFIAQAEKGVIR